MPSDLPSKPPTGGTGSYVRVAVIMLLIAAALVVGKFTLMRSPQPSASSNVVVSEQPKVAVTPPPPPPPPEEEPSASASAITAPTAKSAHPAGVCAGECKGEVSHELRTYLSGRASQGRKCYERALLQNASLKGRMKVQLRVGSQGNLCSAAMAGDELQEPGLSLCILQLFRSSVYPSPQGGCVDVAVPLSFVPQH